jgi:hypothetical protein
LSVMDPCRGEAGRGGKTSWPKCVHHRLLSGKGRAARMVPPLLAEQNRN